MFENQLNEIEVTLEELRSTVDEETWRAALMAVNTMSTPYLPIVVSKAQRSLDPHLPVAPAMLKTAQELSLLLASVAKESRAAYAFSMAVYAMAYTHIREKDHEQRKEG